MPSKGEFIKFKPGIFGIREPNNYGIFIKTKRLKRMVRAEIFTINGKQTTPLTNLYKDSFGEYIQLSNTELPQASELKVKLLAFISLIGSRVEQEQFVADKHGVLSEPSLWKKAIGHGTNFTSTELAQIWYEIKEVSKKQIKKVNHILNPCLSFGAGYFDLTNNQKKKWTLITEEEQKKVNSDISILGQIRKRMFVFFTEEDEETGESISVRKSVRWENIILSADEKYLFDIMEQTMVYYIEYNTWPTGLILGGTHIFSLDGFSFRSYLTNLAEDWLDEGRTSRADSFTKALLKTTYWDKAEALLCISKRAVNLSPDFSWETSNEIEALATNFKEPKAILPELTDRLDLTSLESYTIDPATAKDFDDAISVIKTSSGYTLWVHIADVAFYVKHHSKLDLHARKRSTSVYLPTKTLPMLPTRLSNDLCSLKEQVPRLAMSVQMKFDKDGKKIDGSARIFNTIIEVTKNLTYKFVEQSINEQPFQVYYQFANLVNKHRNSINLETPEVRLEFGKEFSIVLKSATPSTKMIETFMVVTNESIGEIFLKAKVPAIFRCHPIVETEKIASFNAQMRSLELQFSVELPELFKEETPKTATLFDVVAAQQSKFGKMGSRNKLNLLTDIFDAKQDENKDTITPKVKGVAQLDDETLLQLLKPFIEILQQIKDLHDKELQRLAYLTVLKSFSQAFYTAKNLGHFGLGSKKYVHFTSPIRRYSDIIAHRICKKLIEEGRHDGVGDKASEFAYETKEIEQIAEHTSGQTVLADKLERQIVKAGYSFLIKDKNTEPKAGIISSISSGSAFVLLPNGIEARIPFSQLTSLPTFVDDYETMCFIGSKDQYELEEQITPHNYKELLKEGDEPIQVLIKVGDKVRIQFIKLNHIEGQITARPVEIFTRNLEGYEEGKLITLEDEQLV